VPFGVSYGTDPIKTYAKALTASMAAAGTVRRRRAMYRHDSRRLETLAVTYRLITPRFVLDWSGEMCRHERQSARGVRCRWVPAIARWEITSRQKTNF
jgi:hypothetical protein